MNAADAPCPGPFDILVANNLSAKAAHLQTALAAIHASLAEGGFLLLQVSNASQAHEALDSGSVTIERGCRCGRLKRGLVIRCHWHLIM